MGARRGSQRQPGADATQVQDSYEATIIKGPDPEVWGDDEDRPQPTDFDKGGLAIGEIRNEGTPEEIKGPGPEWEQGEEGEYTNR